MQYGVTIMWKELGSFRAQLRAAEAAGFDRIGIGDSPTTYREQYIAMTVAAIQTERVGITSMVQVPLGRHPVVTAASATALQELSDGRVSLTLGAGASGAAALGMRPARLDELRGYVEAVRTLLRGEPAEWHGHVGVPPNDPRPVRIHIATNGRAARRLAGAIGDSAIIGSGPENPLLPELIDDVRQGATEAGRDPAEVEIWVMTRSGIADDPDAALEQVKGSLASTAAFNLTSPRQLETVPEALRGAVLELRDRYDLTSHAVSGGPNSALADELGLTDYLAKRFAMVGTPAECRRQLDALAPLGVAGVQMSAVVLDPLSSIARYAQVLAA